MMSVTALIILLAAVIGSSVLVGFAAWLIYRARGLESGGATDPRALEARMEALQGELEATREEVGRLRERVDFTEKLLSPPEDGPEGER